MVYSYISTLLDDHETSQSITSFSAAPFCACLKMFYSNFLGTRCILYLPTCINRHHEEICIDRITNAQKIQGRELAETSSITRPPFPSCPTNAPQLSVCPCTLPPLVLSPIYLDNAYKSFLIVCCSILAFLGVRQ